MQWDRIGWAHAVDTIQEELDQRLSQLKKENKLLEAQRLEMRTTYDLEMLQQIGTCSGVENYSRHFDNRAAGTPPAYAARLLPRRFPSGC